MEWLAASWRSVAAARLKRSMPEVGVIVHSFDAVCQREQNEFGVYGEGKNIENPLNDKYWSWQTDFYAQFPNQSRLAVLHFTSRPASACTPTGATGAR